MVGVPGVGHRHRKRRGSMHWTGQDKAIPHGQNARQLQPGTMMLPRNRFHSNVELGETQVGNDGLCNSEYTEPDVLCNPSISKT